METPDPRRNEPSPPAAATTEIETLRVLRERVPWEDGEVPLEVLTRFGVGEPGLIEPGPFMTEAGDGLGIEVHRYHPSRRRKTSKVSSVQIVSPLRARPSRCAANR